MIFSSHLDEDDYKLLNFFGLNKQDIRTLTIKLNSAKHRCTTSKNKAHIIHYQKKRIKVNEYWASGADGKRNFLLWCCDQNYEKGMELDRINNDLGYSPENCRFVSPEENRMNRTNCATIQVQNAKKILKKYGFSNSFLAKFK